MFLISEETGWKIAGISFVNFATHPVILANIFMLIRDMITVFKTNGRPGDQKLVWTSWILILGK